MRKRYGILRKNIKNRRTKAFKTIFHLNIFEGEFDNTQEPAVFDERHDPEPVRRELQTTITTLQRSLQETRQELTQKGQELDEKDLTVADLHTRVEDLSENNTFLSNHVNALEKETQDQHQEINTLKANHPPPSLGVSAKTKIRKPLGTMKFGELGQDAKNKTRAAYREKAKELDEFGLNRGLKVNQIILQDENGRKIPINVQKPHTFPNLTAEEKSDVATASAWKDSNRLSDRAYSSMTKIGSIPPAAHVKSFEAEVNAQLGPILPVSLSTRVKKYSKMLNSLHTVFVSKIPHSFKRTHARDARIRTQTCRHSHIHTYQEAQIATIFHSP